MPFTSLLVSAVLTLVAPAHAACDAQLAGVAALTPDAVAPAYQALIACDPKVAEGSFLTFLAKAGDTDAVTALVQVAIDAKLWTPAWSAIGKIPDYDARDEVATNIGAACKDHPLSTTFLQGAYAALRDVDFKQWSSAYQACDDPKLWTWVDAKVKAPPAKEFDEKYMGLANIYGKKEKADALPTLSAAAIAAAGNGGPFNPLLEAMTNAMAPGLGQDMTAEAHKGLEDALVGVAQKTGPDQAKGVATQLANSGAEKAAASLLPTIYPDRVQAGGKFLYGVASVESGTCSGKKTAVIHYTTLTEGGTHWSIIADIEPPLRAEKPKLTKCTMDAGDWPVIYTETPEKASSESATWADARAKEWTDKGYEAKVAKEKEFSI